MVHCGEYDFSKYHHNKLNEEVRVQIRQVREEFLMKVDKTLLLNTIVEKRVELKKYTGLRRTEEIALQQAGRVCKEHIDNLKDESSRSRRQRGRRGQEIQKLQDIQHERRQRVVIQNRYKIMKDITEITRLEPRGGGGGRDIMVRESPVHPAHYHTAPRTMTRGIAEPGQPQGCCRWRFSCTVRPAGCLSRTTIPPPYTTIHTPPYTTTIHYHTHHIYHIVCYRTHHTRHP
jgi:hypothetical protein